MIALLLVVHILIALSLVGVILLQKSEGGALGMGGGGMSGFMTGRSTSNLLTRATAVLAAAFMLTSVFLVLLHNRERAPHSLIDQGPASSQQTPGPAPQQPAAPSSEQAPGPASPQPTAPSSEQAHPEKPAEPSPPLAR
jgi:preprotein translocase subunit SecG